MAHLALTLLGSFRATLDGKLLTAFRSAKVQALLIYLALGREQPHGREVLAALLWPDEPDGVAKKNLRQSLYQIRQILGETASGPATYLLATRSTAQFNPESDHALDVTTFLSALEDGRLEQAVAVYQGDLLPGFTCHSLPFEAWLREERERFHRLAMGALFELASRSLARAEYRTAQELAQRQLALEPWREEAHRQLMEALALHGERSAALAQYEACRRALAEELGAEPTAETEALAERIRAQEVTKRANAVPIQPAGHRRLIIPFVGRKSEHGALVRAYQRAQEEGAQVATLVGEAGIGKTRLAHNFLSWATTRGADVVSGRAFETSGRLSYQPLTQALRQRLERENAPEDLLSDLWLTQLTRILPELRDRYPDLPAPTQEEGTARQHLFEAIARLGQALAERAPLVLFIDDWHWADSASLDVLHYAALRWLEEGAPILVLLTLRHEALTESGDLQTWLFRFKHDVAYVQLNLAPLSGSETERVIHRLLEPGRRADGAARLTRLVDWLFHETDGQPFFLTETLKALVDEGLIRPDVAADTWRVNWSKLEAEAPETEQRILPGVREIIQGWLQRVSAPAADLLLAAAVLGQEASFERLCTVAGVEEAPALAALDELLVRQLLLESDEQTSRAGRDVAYAFSHQKLREVVYEEAGAARRRILHRRAFAALEAASVPAAELVHHARHGGIWDRAVQYSILAGKEAADLFATRVAIAHYETAWRLVEEGGWPESVSGTDRQMLYDGLGRAYEVADRWPQAQNTYEAMIGYARSMGADVMECLGLNRLATVHINGFRDPEQAITLLEEARALAERSGNARGLAETEWNLSLAARIKQDAYEAREHGERALAIARRLGHRQLLARCLNEMAYVHARLHRWDTVEDYANEARDLYAAAGNRIMEADSQRLAGWSQIYSGRPADALTALQETNAFSEEIENVWGQAECAWRMALASLECGRYGEANTLARQAVEQTQTVGQPTMVLLALTTWGAVQRAVMALAPARQTLLAALVDADEWNLSGFEDWALAELCAVHALGGDWERAHRYARRTLQARGDDALLPMGMAGWYETEALLRGGDGEVARTEVERLGRVVKDSVRFRLPWLRSRAVLAAWDGESRRAIAHLQSAGELAAEIGLPGEAWSIHAALAVLYRSQGERAQARQAREAAADIVGRLAESIGNKELRAGFLAADVVRPILEEAGGKLG